MSLNPWSRQAAVCSALLGEARAARSGRQQGARDMEICGSGAQARCASARSVGCPEAHGVTRGAAGYPATTDAPRAASHMVTRSTIREVSPLARLARDGLDSPHAAPSSRRARSNPDGIRAASDFGVDLSPADSASELDTIASGAPGPRLYVRVRNDDLESVFPYRGTPADEPMAWGRLRRGPATSVQVSGQPGDGQCRRGAR